MLRKCWKQSSLNKEESRICAPLFELYKLCTSANLGEQANITFRRLYCSNILKDPRGICCQNIRKQLRIEHNPTNKIDRRKD